MLHHKSVKYKHKACYIWFNPISGHGMSMIICSKVSQCADITFKARERTAAIRPFHWDKSGEHKRIPPNNIHHQAPSLSSGGNTESDSFSWPVCSDYQLYFVIQATESRSVSSHEASWSCRSLPLCFASVLGVRVQAEFEGVSAIQTFDTELRNS